MAKGKSSIQRHYKEPAAARQTHRRMPKQMTFEEFITRTESARRLGPSVWRTNRWDAGRMLREIAVQHVRTLPEGERKAAMARMEQMIAKKEKEMAEEAERQKNKK